MPRQSRPDRPTLCGLQPFMDPANPAKVLLDGCTNELPAQPPGAGRRRRFCCDEHRIEEHRRRRLRDRAAGIEQRHSPTEIAQLLDTEAERRAAAQVAAARAQAAAEIASLQAELAQALAGAEDQRAQGAALEAELGATRDDRDRLRQELDAARLALAGAEDRRTEDLARMAAEVDHERRYWDDERAQLVERADQLRYAVAEASVRADAAGEQARAAEGAAAVLRTERDNALADLTGALAEVSELRRTLKAASDRERQARATERELAAGLRRAQAELVALVRRQDQAEAAWVKRLEALVPKPRRGSRASRAGTSSGSA